MSLMDFCLFPERPTDWSSEHRILDVQDHRSYCDSLEFHFLELPKLRSLLAEGVVEDTGLSRILMYLGRMGGYQRMKSLVERDAGVKRLEDGVRSFFRERGNLALYKLREREETDYRNAFKYREEKALAKGWAKGRAEGRAEGSLEMLFSLVRDGLLSMEKASARAGMTEDDFAARMGRRDSGHPPADGCPLSALGAEDGPNHGRSR